jgi:hypothetical protein
MNRLIHRVVQAYQPLCQRGQLLGGLYRLPRVSLDSERSGSEASGGSNLNRPRRRVLIAALAAAAVGSSHTLMSPSPSPPQECP